MGAWLYPKDRRTPLSPGTMSRGAHLILVEVAPDRWVPNNRAPPSFSCSQEKRVIGSVNAARMTNRPRPTPLTQPLFQEKSTKTSPIRHYYRLFGITTMRPINTLYSTGELTHGTYFFVCGSVVSLPAFRLRDSGKKKHGYLLSTMYVSAPTVRVEPCCARAVRSLSFVTRTPIGIAVAVPL